MILTPLSLFAVALMVRWSDSDDVEFPVLFPALIDLFAWYIVGAYFGVF